MIRWTETKSRSRRFKAGGSEYKWKMVAEGNDLVVSILQRAL